MSITYLDTRGKRKKRMKEKIIKRVRYEVREWKRKKVLEIGRATERKGGGRSGKDRKTDRGKKEKQKEKDAPREWKKSKKQKEKKQTF